MVKVTIRGLRETIAKTRARLERSLDLGPVLRVQAARLTTIMGDGFRRSRSPDGTQFEPLKEATRIQKAALGYDTRPLRRTGKLEAHTVAQCIGGNKIRAGYGPGESYGRYHQWEDHGGARTHLRPFLPFEGRSSDPRIMTSGPIQKWRLQTVALAKAYIMTGKVRGGA